jgi:hypothetical protein
MASIGQMHAPVTSSMQSRERVFHHPVLGDKLSLFSLQDNHDCAEDFQSGAIRSPCFPSF